MVQKLTLVRTHVSAQWGLVAFQPSKSTGKPGMGGKKEATQADPSPDAVSSRLLEERWGPCAQQGLDGKRWAERAGVGRESWSDQKGER